MPIRSPYLHQATAGNKVQYITSDSLYIIRSIDQLARFWYFLVIIKASLNYAGYKAMRCSGDYSVKLLNSTHLNNYKILIYHNV
jgi:hypothetical protein